MNKEQQAEDKDWQSRLVDMNMLSPVYIFLFIILFTNDKNGTDLHDSIVNFVLTFNG